MTKPHQYEIQAIAPAAHLFEVSLLIDIPDPSGQLVRLPAWIPGSYMIRDFAKNVVTLEASSCNAHAADLAVEKVDKSTWRIEPCTEAIRITYTVYAWDLSVRSAHLDQTHGYFNGTSVFLEVCGQAGSPCQVTILAPIGADYKKWRVATSLPTDRAKLYGFGTYLAENYDALIDHPVEMGDFTLAHFEACGVTHDVVLSGKHSADLDRLCRDLRIICETQIRFFGEPAPFDRYVFLTLVVGEGYGGLEHRASTSLLCSRKDLPKKKDSDTVTDAYRGFLGLCSHEYFHSWNVKRIKPAKFCPFDLTQEVHTHLLWAFEGITSYYDDLMLLRCGLITAESYLELLSQTISRVHKGAGRHKQTVTDSSYDTWTKFYQQDENAANGIVSYYAKGAIVALALDLTLRKKTSNRCSLDSIMHKLWQNYLASGEGIGELEIESIAQELSGLDLSDFFEKALRGTEDLPLNALLQNFGVQLKWRAEDKPSDFGGKPSTLRQTPPYLGARVKPNNEVAVVMESSPAQKAGLSAGDLIIAVNKLKLVSGTIDSVVQDLTAGDVVQIHAFRRDELMRFDAELSEPPLNTCYFEIEDKTKFEQWTAASGPTGQ